MQQKPSLNILFTVFQVVFVDTEAALTKELSHVLSHLNFLNRSKICVGFERRTNSYGRIYFSYYEW